MSWKDRAKPVVVSSAPVSSNGNWKSRATLVQNQTSLGEAMKGIAGNAINEALMRKGSYTRDLMQDPVTQAKALPALTGVLGGAIPIPGGSTIGTVGGRQLSNAALRAYGRPEEIPSASSQAGEAALSVFGDIAVVPAIKSRIFGNQIGKAMKKAGLGNIEKAAPPSGIRTAIKLAQQVNSKELTQAEAAALKPAIDSIWKKGWLGQEAYKQYAPDVAKASAKIAATLNTVPGREAPAMALRRAMAIPNAIKGAYQATRKLPLWAQIALGTTPVAGGGLLAALKER